MQTKLPELFGRLPVGKCEVLSVEEYLEKEAPAAFYVKGAPDGSRPGHIKVNTRDYKNFGLSDVETTAYHEGVPGHHLQGTIAQELPALPKYRQQNSYIAFSEGWALYAERLGKEVGFFQHPHSYYAHLQT